MRVLTVSAAVFAALASSADAQFGNEWVTFERSDASLSAGTISSNNLETDLAWGDLDKNGLQDIVVVRKQPFTSPGKRTNVLLMNEGGVLTDRTIQFAAASDVAGDLGFRTATNDRDVVVVDVDNDGWLDVVTATTISDGDPKHIGHPRVYMNLGEDGAGDWLGLEHQDARIPQFFHTGTGQPENPRFCSVTFGDVNGDGSADLYFGDYDSSGAGGAQQPGNKDLNDRLLINDGNGFFSDESQARMTSQMLLSAFGTAVDMGDLNGDGTIDIIKDTALNAPQYVAISYNNLAGLSTEGDFNVFDNTDVGSGAPYHVDIGDLNQDGRLDVITSDDGLDRYRINTGNDALGRATFTGAQAYDFLQGGDDGFASNNLIADLDSDGWPDALYADIDVDIPGGSRRLHVYHNRGGEDGAAPGDMITMREERETGGAGWIGVGGMVDSDLRETHDMAVFDINGDGSQDIFISREAGTFVWLNATSNVCQPDLGFGNGTMALSVCGDALVSEAAEATVTLEGATPGSTVFMIGSLSNNPAPLFGGTLVPNPILFSVPVPIGAEAGFTAPVRGVSTSVDLFIQGAANVGGWTFSNAVQIEFGP